MGDICIDNWDYDKKPAEEQIRALLPFFEGIGLPTEKDKTEKAGKLYEFLHKCHDGLADSYLRLHAGALDYRQYGEKEYYHDGSEQRTELIRIETVSGEAFEDVKARNAKYSSFYLGNILLLLPEVIGDGPYFYDEKTVYVKDFLGCFPYMSICRDSWI